MTMFRILLVVAVQTLALAWMIMDRQQMLDSSRVVTLKVVPVDPRDLFRGDYVVLSYEISRLDLAKLGGTDDVAPDDKVYVTLDKVGEDWKPVTVSKTLQKATGSSVSMAARVINVDQPGTDGSKTIMLGYGIESYFVPQGTGLAIEQEARKGTISVDAAVDDSGRAAIKALRRDGKVFLVEGIL